jgi:hypothetical protein
MAENEPKKSLFGGKPADDPKNDPKPEGGTGSGASVTMKPVASPGDPSAAPKGDTAKQAADAEAKRLDAGQVKMPSVEELEEARKSHFGDEVGTVAIDADPANTRDAKVELVFLDGNGEEVGREPYQPKDEGGDNDNDAGATTRTRSR